MSNRDYFFKKLIDFVFRRRTPALILLRISSGLVIASLLGYSIGVELPTKYGPLSLRFDSDASSLSWIVYLAAIAGALGILVGFLWLFLDFKRSSKRAVCIIELRGLRNFAGQSIEEFWPSELFENKRSILIDVRENIVDGKLTSPQTAMEEINRIPAYVRTFERGKDRDDVSYVAGGLAAVPLTFLAGVMLDDEHAITLVDWDRQAKSWRLLDALDDGDEILFSGIDALANRPEEIVLLASLSYGVDQAAVESVFPGFPQVKLSLESATVNNHWSEEKQQRVGSEFLNLAQRADANGVKKIHLVLAAQSSVVMRLGGHYDKRNLPELVVYQYEKGASNPYPWGIKMPIAASSIAEVVHT